MCVVLQLIFNIFIISCLARERRNVISLFHELFKRENIKTFLHNTRLPEFCTIEDQLTFCDAFFFRELHVVIKQLADVKLQGEFEDRGSCLRCKLVRHV